MLLSITIDTAHPDAQGDARTAIQLLQDTFDFAHCTLRMEVNASEMKSAISDAIEQVAEARTATPQPPEPVIEANPATPEAHAHTGPVTTSLTAAVTPLPNSPARALIPGTDTYVPVDVNGLPWDKRIHASTQAFVADGSWRRKPKVSDEDFKRISDELHVIMAAPAAGAIVTQTAAVPTAAEAFAQPAPQPEGPTTFIEFMTWIGGHSHAQRLTLANVSDVMAELGLVNAEGRGAVALIDKRPDLIPAAYQKLSALLPAGEVQ